MTWPTFFWLLFNRIDTLTGLALAALLILIDPFNHRSAMPGVAESATAVSATVVLTVSTVLLLSRLIRWWHT